MAAEVYGCPLVKPASARADTSFQPGFRLGSNEKSAVATERVAPAARCIAIVGRQTGPRNRCFNVGGGQAPAMLLSILWSLLVALGRNVYQLRAFLADFVRKSSYKLSMPSSSNKASAASA